MNRILITLLLATSVGISGWISGCVRSHPFGGTRSDPSDSSGSAVIPGISDGGTPPAAKAKDLQPSPPAAPPSERAGNAAVASGQVNPPLRSGPANPPPASGPREKPAVSQPQSGRNGQEPEPSGAKPQTGQPGSVTDPTPEELIREDNQGEVEVQAVFANPIEPQAEGVLVFYIGLNTHSVSLASLDLTKAATLELIPGPTVSRGFTWEPDGDEDHHRSGLLRVLLPDPGAVDQAAEIRLTLKEVGGIPKRVFEWENRRQSRNQGR